MSQRLDPIWQIRAANNVSQSETPVVRNLTLSKGELSSWLQQTDDFAIPHSLVNAKVKGTLRLLYQCRDCNADKSEPHELQISRQDWASIIKHMELPLSYNFDLANRKHISTRIVLGHDQSAPKVSKSTTADRIAQYNSELILQVRSAKAHHSLIHS